MSRGKILAVCAVIAALTVILVLTLAACGQRARQVAQLTLTPLATEQPAEGQDSDDGGVLPGVLELDALAAGTCKSVRNGTQVISFGADYSPDLSGTTSDHEYSIEPSGTSLNLRGYEPGDYAYALYGQAIGDETKPLQTLIDSDPCAFGGGQDDDIPLVYYVGLADYTLGTWRWYGPFIDDEPPYEDIDALITVNSETLKSRFTSPSDNFYLCVLTTNPGRATSSLSNEGLAAELPFEPRARAASADELDPGGVRIEVVTTDTEEGLETEPAVVTGLTATADTIGVTLEWDSNPDPDVDIYQVFRDDLDDEDPPDLLQGVLAPIVTYQDVGGIPGKEYQYAVRARNETGYGGKTCVDAIRSLEAPVVTASDGILDYIEIEWTAVEGAVSYRLYRGETSVEGDASLLAELDAETLSYSDAEPPIGAVRWYWVRATGEDTDGPLSLPDSGVRAAGQPPAVPTGLAATYGEEIGIGKVYLTWNANVETDLVGYYVYRRPQGGTDFNQIASVDKYATDYTDSGLSLGTYGYALSAYNTLMQESELSYVVYATPFYNPPPEPPTNFQAQNTGTPEGTIKLTWTLSVSMTVDHYEIYRQAPGEVDFGLLTEVPDTATQYTDWGLTLGETYSYKMRAVDAWDTPGDFTAPVSATPAEENTPPIADLTADPTEGNVPLLVDFNASGSYDPDGTIVKYEWDYDGDGAWDSTTDIPTSSFEYQFNGIYLPTVRVTDDRDSTSTDSASVTVGGWMHTWGGTESEEISSLYVTSGDEVFVSGVTFTFGQGDADVLLLKYGSDGGFSWAKTWGGWEREVPFGVLADSSGNVYIAGYTKSFCVNDNSDAFVLKYDSSGTLVWAKKWGIDAANVWEGFANIEMDGSGNIFVAGAGWGVGDDPWLLKLDSSGSAIWGKFWEGDGDDSTNDIALDGSGNIYMTGRTNSYGVLVGEGNDLFVVKVNSDGSLAWDKTWGGDDNDLGYAIALDASGNIYVTGFTASFGQGAQDVLLVKFTSDGTFAWAKTWGGGGTDLGRSIAFDPAGYVYVTGYTYSAMPNYPDIILLKYDIDGNLLSDEVWDNGADYGTAAMFGPDSTLYIGGIAPSILGSLVDVAGTVGAPSGTVTEPSAPLTDASADGTDIVGVESYPTGTEDVGGGGNDALVIKYKP